MVAKKSCVPFVPLDPFVPLKKLRPLCSTEARSRGFGFVTIESASASDAFGDPLDLTTVDGGVNIVPEPTTLTLIALALLSLLAYGRRTRA